MTIAVMFTTFNRKQKTLACIESLAQQVLHADTKLELFITDDCSSDGTAEAVQEKCPNANVYTGTGSLFWAGGMRYTWEKAFENKPEFFLLINDDTYLSPNAISTLIDTYNESDNKATIVIGSTYNEESGKISYGGWKLKSKFFWKSKIVQPGSTSVACDFANANIMLVPKNVPDKIGILSAHFTHSLADYDYSLKANKSGCSVVIAPGFLGSCVDDHGNNWKSPKTTLRERLIYLKSPKGLAYKEYLKFIKDHFPFSYPSELCKLWTKTFFPILWETFKK